MRKKAYYIGKTNRSFIQRLCEHQKYKLRGIRGTIKVRLGILEFPYGGKFSKEMLSDVESLLIVWHKPILNYTSNVYYSGRFDFKIVNYGRRGQIDKVVTDNKLEWAWKN